MANFDNHIEPLIQKEGGWLLHKVKNDKGGMTFAGIAINHNRDWEGWDLIRSRGYKPGDIIHDRDIQQLTKERYREKYWRFDNMEDEVAEILFSSSVLSGLPVAVKLAQMASEAHIDGAWGPNTEAAINNFDSDHFISRFALARIARFTEIANRNKSQRGFLRGWINRVLKELPQ